jgi:LysR substrate binding domain
VVALEYAVKTLLEQEVEGFAQAVKHWQRRRVGEVPGGELTEAGKVFLAGVKEMPLIAERATMAARRAARGETGLLRVGFTWTATFNVVVPRAIRTFRRAYPEIHLTLEEANTTRLITGLREGTLDVVFLRPGPSGTEELQLRQLSDDSIVFALPKRHPAAALEEIDLAILKDDPFLFFPREIAPTLYDTIVDACRKAGFQPVIGQVAGASEHVLFRQRIIFIVWLAMGREMPQKITAANKHESSLKELVDRFHILALVLKLLLRFARLPGCARAHCRTSLSVEQMSLRVRWRCKNGNWKISN